MYKAATIVKVITGVISALGAIFFLIATVADKDGKADYEAEKEVKREYYREKLGLTKK